MKKCHHKFLKESLEEFEYEILDKFLETVEIKKKNVETSDMFKESVEKFLKQYVEDFLKKMGKIVKHVVKRIFRTCCIFGRNS